MANTFLPFGASGTSLNLMSDAEYAASNTRAQGFGVGYADERLANKAWLQATTAIAALMQFTADNTGQSISDSLPVSTLESSFYLALVNAMNAAGFGVASGTDAYTVTLSPAPTSFQTGNEILVFFNNPNTITNPTLNVNGLGASPVVKQLGGALVPGDLSGFVSLIRDGSGNWRFNGLAQSSAGRLIGVQTFSATGVYVPSPGMKYCIVEAVGGGGAGAGAGGASGAGNVSLGAPGTSGTYGRAFFTKAQIADAQNVTIGAGGASTSGGNGGAGGTTSLGGLLILPGGVGGLTLTNQTAPTVNGNGTTSGAASGTPGPNILSQPGSVGSITTAITSGIGQGGPGGFNPLGTGGYGSNVNGPGASGTGFGSGGAGCFVNASGGSIMGGAGRPGGMIITEYGI